MVVLIVRVQVRGRAFRGEGGCGLARGGFGFGGAEGDGDGGGRGGRAGDVGGELGGHGRLGVCGGWGWVEDVVGSWRRELTPGPEVRTAP